MSNKPENTPQLRLKMFIDTIYSGDISRFAKDIGKKYDLVKQYIGENGSIFGGRILPLLGKAKLNPVWYLTGEGEMLLSEQSAETMPTINNRQLGVPYYPIDVTASIIESFNDIPEVPEFYVYFPPFNDCAAYLQVRGDSMFPKYASGDLIAVKPVSNYDTLLWGETYLVITDSETNGLRTLKHVFQAPDPGSIILRAANPEFPGDTVIPKRSILNLFVVKGKITQNMY